MWIQHLIWRTQKSMLWVFIPCMWNKMPGDTEGDAFVAMQRKCTIAVKTTPITMIHLWVFGWFVRLYRWSVTFCGNNTESVAQNLPNGFGLYDMHGNIGEYTTDWYGCNFPLPMGSWCSTTNSSRVVRSGHWFYDPSGLRVSFRGNVALTTATNDLVFDFFWEKLLFRKYIW